MPGGEADNSIATMARGGVLNLVGAAGFAVLTFVTVVVVARGLGPGRAGVFFQASALFLIVSNVCELGADTGLVRMIPRYRALGRSADVSHAVRAGIIPGTALAALAAAGLYVIAPDVAPVLTQPGHQAELARDLRLLVPFLPISVLLTLVLSATRGLGKMAPTVVVDRLGRSALQLVAVAVAALGGLGSAAVALAWAAPYAVALVAAVPWLTVLHRRTRAKPANLTPIRPRPQEGRVAREFWRFSLPRALAATLKVSIDKLDILLVGSLASARAAGIYTASTRFLIAGTMANVAISQALGPMVSRFFTTGARQRVQAAWQSASAWVTLLTWPMYLQCIVFAPVILRVFGRQYDAGATAVAVVAASMLVGNIVGPVDVVLLMGGRSISSLTNMTAGLVVNVGLNLVLIPRLGLTGAGLAWAASILVINCMALGQVWRSLAVHPIGAGVVHAAAGSSLCFGVVALVARLVGGAGVVPWLASCVGGTILFAVFCWQDRRVLDLPSVSGLVRRAAPSDIGSDGLSAHSLSLADSL